MLTVAHWIVPPLRYASTALPMRLGLCRLSMRLLYHRLRRESSADGGTSVQILKSAYEGTTGMAVSPFCYRDPSGDMFILLTYVYTPIILSLLPIKIFIRTNTSNEFTVAMRNCESDNRLAIISAVFPALCNLCTQVSVPGFADIRSLVNCSLMNDCSFAQLIKRRRS
jgi:hypothetical protein